MNKKWIVLLGLLLGAAVVVLGGLLLMMGRSQGQVPQAAAPTAAETLITAAPTPEATLVPTEDPRLQLSSGPVDRDATELTLSSVTEEDLARIRELSGLTLLDGRV